MKDTDNKLIYEAFDTPDQRKFGVPGGRGAGSDSNGWSSEGLEELEPNELVEFINERLPQFLQTHFEPEAYDDVHKALYKAAYTINWELGDENNNFKPPRDPGE